jgi:hypothetical protein
VHGGRSRECDDDDDEESSEGSHAWGRVNPRIIASRPEEEKR